MRQQLRLRVLVPVAVLGLLGAGFGAFAMGGPADARVDPDPARDQLGRGRHRRDRHGRADTAIDTDRARRPHRRPRSDDDGGGARAGPASRSRRRRRPSSSELAAHRVVVVVFHTPGSDLDGAALREARAGAVAATLASSPSTSTKEGDVADLAAEYEVLGAPTVLVVVKAARRAPASTAMSTARPSPRRSRTPAQMSAAARPCRSARASSRSARRARTAASSSACATSRRRTPS